MLQLNVEKNDGEKVISRAKALTVLSLIASGGLLAAASVYYGRRMYNDADDFLRYVENEKKFNQLHTPDVVIPEELLESISDIDKNLKSIEGKIRESEGGDVPKLDSNSIFALYIAQNLNSVPAVRNDFFENPDDFPVWVTGAGEYDYDFSNRKPEFTGGTEEKRSQAEEIFNEYFTADQFRVGEVKLTDRNNAGNNVIEWEAGSPGYTSGKFKYPWRLYSAYIHELTHAGVPLNFSKAGAEKAVLLPYGLKRTVEFVKMWTHAMDQEYDFFKLRFFKADGDETLSRIRSRQLGFGSALSEMVAMLSADYVFPSFDTFIEVINGGEPLDKFPLTERAIRKSISYVHHGIQGSDKFPDGVERRLWYSNGTYVGDLFWKIYNFAISDIQNPTP